MPRLPDQQSGHRYGLNVQGVVVYFTSRERHRLCALGSAAVVWGVCLAVVVYLEVQRRRATGEPFATGKLGRQSDRGMQEIWSLVGTGIRPQLRPLLPRPRGCRHRLLVNGVIGLGAGVKRHLR